MPRGIPRDQSVNRRFAHRLKIARGHLDKVIRMVEEGEYCIDILHQSLAVQKAIREVDTRMLEHHLTHCVASFAKKGNNKETVDEVLQVFRKISA
jgi:CsoR family transcriptional regulator, copper-sensing transcriptional repressor